jgi:hypothetical protein
LRHEHPIERVAMERRKAGDAQGVVVEVVRQLLARAFEAGQRLVLLAIDRVSLGFETREIVWAARHALKHYRPTRPSTGLLALA